MKLSTTDRIFDAFNYLFLTIFGFLTLYPFYYLIIYSVSDPQEVIKGIYFWPRGFTLDNYRTVFELDRLVDATIISLLRTVIGTALTVICCTLFAYSLTKSLLPLRKFMYRGLVVSMYVSGGFIPSYLLISDLRLLNSFWVYILPMIVVPFYLILIKTYIEQLPAELEESAMVEGAGYYRVFFSIILPLSMPILATIAIFQAVGHWNSWADNLFYATDPKLMTLQLMLLNLVKTQTISTNVLDAQTMSSMKVTPESIRTTVTVVVILPVMLIYPFLQKYFIKGIILGAVKG
ncbi:carbohydrate ABC transporter permease [Cohnella silvisoli]|uniref:Carbohydrate ABC transporter permease n=1 Tax=Cohnella silvisoli TaxID=2873699 RepID=A0ABV1L0X3_9BACL|nr:carbohydrate ABC transporter permease [Cohnella silvisoli]